MMTASRPFRLATLALLFALLPAHASAIAQPVSASERAKAIDAAAAQALDSLSGAVPGMQIAVVQGDSVTYRGAFGMRDVSTGAPVTDTSSFYVASVTKSFTGMLAAVLAEDGTIALDAPLSSFFPDLAFDSTALDAERIRLRDHLAHRSGYTNAVLAERPPYLFRLDGDALTRALGRESAPRAVTFDYSNENYIVAAAALAQTTGTSWKALMEARLFDPLGMDRTTPHMSVAQSQQMTAPHAVAESGLTVIEAKADTNMHAAGGVVSTASDLGVWLRAVMNEGALGETQVLPRQAVQDALAPQVHLDARYQFIRRYAYGLGWYHGEYRGDVLMHHFGGFRGHHAHVSFMPAHDTGVVVLTNSGIPAPHLVAAQIYDLLLERANPKRYAQFLQRGAQGTERILAQREKTRREWLDDAEDTPTMRPSAAYAGRYVHPSWGVIDVTAADGSSGGGLRVTYGPRSAPLIPHRRDIFRADLLVGLDLPVKLTFETGPDGMTLRTSHPHLDLNATFQRENE